MLSMMVFVPFAGLLSDRVGRKPLWWFSLVFVVISISTYKLPQYLYPLTPAAALLAAEELERLDDVMASRWRWMFIGVSAVAVVFAFVAAVFGAIGFVLGAVAFVFSAVAAVLRAVHTVFGFVNGLGGLGAQLEGEKASEQEN